MTVLSTNLGFPRIGVSRELKKALESYWSQASSIDALEAAAAGLRRRHWLLMKEAGLDHIPSNDFSLYDHMLDAACLFDAVPERYREIPDAMERYFAMARGLQAPALGIDVAALEMTKWFDTNYHYIVPELEHDQVFSLNPSKILKEINEARALGIEVRPVIPGPITFLKLSKLAAAAHGSHRTIDLLDKLLPCYEELFTIIERAGIAWLQLDEPCLVGDLDAREIEAYRRSFSRLSGFKRRPKVVLTSYFGSLGPHLSLALHAGFEALHVDLARAPEQFDLLLDQIGEETILSMGLVDGRNVWRCDLDASHALLRRALTTLGAERVFVGPSCSLLHVPVDLSAEGRLSPEIKDWLAFATQKLAEIKALSLEAPSAEPASPIFADTRRALEARRLSPLTNSPDVRERLHALSPGMLRREAYPIRAARQKARYGLPILPTTTIGSFPQTADVRSARASWRAGRLSDSAYQSFLEEETRNCIERQETLGLDVLVHGEFERNDMVEYFGEQLAGFAFTEHGWVQSYGSRYVKPPLLYGDVSRPKPMTVAWSRYAQSLTTRPMKGMLTGPLTILQWSFVRNDQSRSATCMQIGLALRDEVSDLEAAGISMIQVDEPALREGLPLRRSERQAYLQWAVDAFRLATSGISSDTQIHTHMCYAEFGDILEAIEAMDADVISIETSRSKMEILENFGVYRYPNEVGPGVYDIHSPRVPTRDEMEELLIRASEVLPPDRLWVNPDCGLKTRAWTEVEAALSKMVDAAHRARKRLQPHAAASLR